MYIKVLSGERVFTTMLHMVAKDSSEQICFLSVAGLEVAIKATLASVIEGRSLRVFEKDGDNERIVRTLEPARGAYTFEIERSGDTTLGFIMAKSLLQNKEVVINKDDDVAEEDKPESFLIMAEDGDTQAAVGNFFANRYSLPELPEHKEVYPYLFSGYLEKADVLRNPKITKWRDAKFAIVRNITENEVLTIVDKALRQGLLSCEDHATSGHFEPGWDVKRYLQENAPFIAKEIDSITPYHDMTSLDPVIASLGRIPLPVQAHAAQAIYNRFGSGAHYAFLNGEMGSGKSISANTLVKMLSQKGPVSVLLTAPATVIPKWIDKELNVDLPEAKIRFLNSTDDILKFRKQIKNGYKPKGIEFTLVSIDRVKLGPNSWAGAALWRRTYDKYQDSDGNIRLRSFGQYCWHCPDCFTPQLDPTFEDKLSEEERPLAGWSVMANKSSANDSVSWKQRSKLKKCHKCGSPLWRPATKAAGDKGAKAPRWYISRILKNDFKKYFDLYISDEIHQQKAADSGRGDALGQIVRSAKHILGLTGTLTNGASTSIKEILWRIHATKLLNKGFDRNTGMVQWASQYGVLEKITKTPIGDQGIVTRKRAPYLQVREKPGINPKLPVDFLYDSTVFIDLPDLGLPLVEKKEIPVFVRMDEEHAKCYSMFHQKLQATCKKCRNFGPFIPATINYADRPDLGGLATFNYLHNGELLQEIVTAPKLEGYTAKERKLVELVQSELDENRSIVIYVSYTGKYGIQHRLKHVLEQHGIEASTLPTSVSPSRRVEWLKKKEKEGARAIISNMRLVSTGIDLIPWPSLVFYQLDYNANTVRQAAGRSWRIGQFRECRVYYMIMDGTQQVSQFERVMLRRGHAMLVEGKVDKSELAKYSRDEHSSLAADIADCIADSNLSQSWQELAVKDNLGVEMIAEQNYEDVVRNKMLQLANETRLLCGIIEDEALEMEIKTKAWAPGDIQLTIVNKLKRRGRRVLANEGQVSLAI